MTTMTAIATPEDAAKAKVTLSGTPRDGAFSEGLPPAPLPGDMPVPSIQIDDRPSRRCAKCGSIMTMFLCEHVFINGLISSGKRMHFRCTACGKEIKLRSWGRLCLIFLPCPILVPIVLLMLFGMLHDPAKTFSSVEGIVAFCFALACSLYPFALVSEIITRFRYQRLGGGLARSLGDFSTNAAPASVRETLFGNLPLGRWPEGSLAAHPWNVFVKARTELADRRQAAAVACWREVLASPGLDSRHYLQAWHFLRLFGGQAPPPEVARQVLGVIVEFGGLDMIVAYADHSARWYNFYSGEAKWERPDDSLDAVVDRLLAAGAAAVVNLSRSKEPGWPLPEAGEVRLSFLTPSGVHFDQGSLERFHGDARAALVMQEAMQVMQTLREKTSSRA